MRAPPARERDAIRRERAVRQSSGVDLVQGGANLDGVTQRLFGRHGAAREPVGKQFGRHQFFTEEI